MECGAGYWCWELREEGGDEGGSSTMRDEEDCLREFWSRLFDWTSLRLLVRVTGSFFGFWRSSRVDGRSVGEGAEIDEEIDEVDLSHLRRDKDIFLDQSGWRCNARKRNESVNQKSDCAFETTDASSETCMNGLILPGVGSRCCSATTGSVRVAVKSSVCRSAGNWSMRKDSSGAKVGVNSRSASSRTYTSSLRQSQTLRKIQND